MSDSRRILLVEDNPIDVRATKRALSRLTNEYLIDVVNDGDEALAYMTSAEATRPDLVLLDLNLPGRDGYDVLSAIKNDRELRRIPVVMLTTSASDADVLGAYDRGANAYVTKPVDLQDWTDLVSVIEQFWFSLVRLPPR